MAVLIGMSAEVKGKNFEIDRDKVSIGRSSTNQIAIEHATVSGRHCCIVRQGDRYVLTDLGSTKDLVQIGSVEFMFDAEGASTEDTHSFSQAQVEVTSGPPTAPISFGSISPFGARRRSNTALWYTVIIIIGLLALAGVVIFLYVLIAK